MPNDQPVTFVEDAIPLDGIETAIDELVELYGGSIEQTAARQRRMVLPLRRGVASSGGIECTLAWEPDDDGDGTVTLSCDRDVDAPKAQRLAMLIAGVIGSFLFLLWPFFPPYHRELGTLAWVGGAIAISVYFLSLRKTSGGIAYDFLKRLAQRQRMAADE